MEFESKFLDWCLLGPGLGSVAVAVLDSKTNHEIFLYRYVIINLFTTSDSPNIRIPILQIFVFVIEGGQENIFLLVENIVWTNKKCFLVPLQ